MDKIYLIFITSAPKKSEDERTSSIYNVLKFEYKTESWFLLSKEKKISNNPLTKSSAKTDQNTTIIKTYKPAGGRNLLKILK